MPAATASDPLSLAFGALADPTRRDIVKRLRGGSSTVGDLAANYEISRPAVSQHLAVLEKAGIVVRERRQQWSDCSLALARLDEASGWIEEQRAEWSKRFDRLDGHLRRERETRTGGDRRGGNR